MNRLNWAGTRRRSVIAAIGLAAIILMLAGCTAPWESTPTPEPHDAFSYSKFSSVDPSKDFHPGDEITFTWEPTSEGTVHQEEPNQITLRAGLYGPFDTVDQLKDRMTHIRTPLYDAELNMTGAAVQADPIVTDSWTNRTFTSTLTLPDTLEPGFYSFVRSSTSSTSKGSVTGEGQAVLRVVAR